MQALPGEFSTFGDFANRHQDQTIVVCGCGASLDLLVHPERFVTIGVNDIGRRFTPDYLVVVNEERQFDPDRYVHVKASQAKAIFTPYALAHPRAVRFGLGRRGGASAPGEGACLDYSNNSPYVAVNLARHLGARRIGLIGVDFTDHHFFGPTGRHPLAGQLPQIDRDYAALAAALRDAGIELVNLSPGSRLTSLPKVGLEWLTAPAGLCKPASGQQGALRIISYATTPVAGVPAILARCINAATGHTAHCVWASRDYGNGVCFVGGTTWREQPREAMALLEAADVVIVHNGKTDPAHQRLLRHKRLVTLAHNYGWNVDMQHVRRGLPGLVVGQYQAGLPEFAGWGVVPNPMEPWLTSATAGSKSEEVIHIAYTPSGRHESYPEGHRLFWHGKGWDSTLAVLHRLARLPNVSIETTEHGQVSHDQALAIKQRAHIVIDECVTGSYHRNSLEGLAAGAVVVNATGLLPQVVQALGRCAPGADRVPFVFSTLDSLERTLHGLIDQGPAHLAAQGRENQAWMARHWSFARQWPAFWADACQPAPRQTLANSSQSANEAPMKTTPLSAAPLVSVVVPHGGVARLPQLAATLATLRQQAGRLEIIVVELGASPLACDCAARWADKHVFIAHNGSFERALALNAAQAVAAGELMLWHDNDLLLPPGFIARAAQELRERSLDFLTPYTAVRYLSAADSQQVMQGTAHPADCQPLNVLRSGVDASGGIGLVRRDFLQRHGGFVEGFRGWGGEDNAWNHKVALLGRSACTLRQDQPVHHLYHPNSGGGGPGEASRANPHYAANVALMQRVCAARSVAEFMRQFPTKQPAVGKLSSFNSKNKPAPATVWAYWEGPCPQWIRACLRTLGAASPSLRLLTPESFDRLRDSDRDIDLSRLQVAHRADFVRLYLLQRFGGLWVDADCLAMQPLQGVLDLLQLHETIGHRERSGLVSNGFLAARADSRIVGSVYQRVCAILRSQRALGWTSLGSEPLTAAVAENASGWHELPCERVQPICWSRPEAFFEERSTTLHAQAFDAQALCYMLSNHQIGKYLASRPKADLMKPGTFFSFLVQRTMKPAAPANPQPYEQVFENHATLYRSYRDESVSGPGSSLAQTAALRSQLPLLLNHLGVRTLLDAPCGDFNWMQHVELGLDAYIGVDILTELMAELQLRHGCGNRRFIRQNLIEDVLPHADTIICRDLLPHLKYSEIDAVLRNFRRSGATYLITTTFTGERTNHDTSGGKWRTLNLGLPPFNFPPPLLSVNEKCSEGAGAFADKCLAVWRLDTLPLDDFSRTLAMEKEKPKRQGLEPQT